MIGSRLFWKLYLGYIVLVLLTAAIVGTLIGRSVERQALADLRTDLDRATVVLGELSRDFPAVPSADSGTALQSAVTRVGRATGIRLTRIRADGQVLADSERSPEGLDNHASRPEVEEARRDGVGTSLRVSGTLGIRMLYRARRLEDGGFARASVGLDSVADQQARLRRTVAAGAGLAAVAALLLGFPFGRSFSEPLVKMSQTARSIAAGDYRRRLAIDRHDEMGTFAHSFNVMAGTLQERIETLTNERNRVLTVLGSMVEGVVAVDPDRAVILMNEVAGEILDADPAAAVGKRLGTVTRRQEIDEVLADSLASNVSRSREVRFGTHDAERTLELHSAPIRGTGGEVAGAVVVLHDVTELRRLEGVRRDFVANVSHELKTPLTVVRGLVETLVDDPGMPPETRQRFLGKVGVQAERLSAIVRDLLNLARVEAAEQELATEELDLLVLARDSFRALAPSAEARGVRLAMEAAEETLPVSADRSGVRLALDNLLDNAVKYTPSGGRVSLRVRREAGWAVVEVEDSGIGIPESHRERIFERFYRVDKARSRDLGGTGLGLSIVRNVLAAHGGRVECESAVGRGSVFRAWFPLLAPDEPRPAV